MAATRVPDRKDNWDKSRVVISAAVPIVIAFIGWLFTVTLRDRQAQAEYVNLAVSILQSPDTAEVGRELRLWAGQILDELGPIPMSEGLRAAIGAGAVVLPVEWPTTALDVDPDLVRLEIRLHPNLRAILDDNRQMGPRAAKWTTRVAPGSHRIEWFNADDELVCEFDYLFAPGDSAFIGCDPVTGRVDEVVI